jgi:hypothetical protein
LFQKISKTLEFGRRLSALEGGNSVGIDTELAQMAHMIQTGQLVELQGVIPVLRQIAADRNSSQNTRQLAQGILKETEGRGGSNPIKP